MGVIADKIRRAIFGGEVRDSIADGIEVVEQLREDYDNQVINAGNSNAEIVDARGGQTKLKDRLDNFDEQLDSIETIKATKEEVNVERERINEIVALPPTVDNVETTDIRVGVNGIKHSSAGESVRTQISEINEILDVKNNYDDIDLVIGRWRSTSAERVNENQLWIASNRLNLNKGDYFYFDKTLYVAQLVTFPNMTDVLTTTSSNITNGKINIDSNGIYAIQLYKVANGEFTLSDLTIAKGKIILKSTYSNKFKVNEENLKAIKSNLDTLSSTGEINSDFLQVEFYKFKINGTNSAFFHTGEFKSENSITVTYPNSSYDSLYAIDLATNTPIALSSGIVLNAGRYQIEGYRIPLVEVTDTLLQTIKSEFVFTSKTTMIMFEKGGIESAKTRLKPYMEGDIQKVKQDLVNEFKYPTLPVWGHEYLQHWYETVYEAEKPSARVVLDGDSITEGYPPAFSGINDTFLDMRGYAIKKIMKVGNYPMSKLTVINNGHGGRNTNEWVGNAQYGLPTWISQYPNGFLDVAMKSNPDLLIISWGMNDADKTHTPFQGLSTQQRLELFEKNMREGLQRIRGNYNVNGRPSYNKKTADLSIIICMPTVGGGIGSGRGNYLWNQYVREIIRPLCREFECAFVDMTMRTYAHNDMIPRIWSGVTSDGVGRDNIHPNKQSSAQTMSMLQDLIYPICMWKIDTSDF